MHLGEGTLVTGSTPDPARYKNSSPSPSALMKLEPLPQAAGEGGLLISFNYMIQIALAPVSALPVFHRHPVSGLPANKKRCREAIHSRSSPRAWKAFDFAPARPAS